MTDTYGQEYKDEGQWETENCFRHSFLGLRKSLRHFNIHCTCPEIYENVMPGAVAAILRKWNPTNILRMA